MSRKAKRELSVSRLELFKKEVTTDIHIIPLKELCERLNTDNVLGMDKAEAKARLEKNGLNTLTPPTQDTKIVKFIKLLFQGFSCLLWVGVLLCCAAIGIEYVYHGLWDVDNMILAIVLILIIFTTTLFMYFQQMKSTKIMESFSTMIPQNAVVIRSGAKMIVNVKELVVGDLVQIKSGDRIPADIRLTKCQGFKVDNSSLTGEDQALFRTAESTNYSFLETGNVAFFSTNAVEGTAEGIVVMCGDQTIMGRIAGLTARLQARSTPIAKELHRFMKFVSIWACFLGIVFGSASIAMGYPWLDSALFIIGIIVANVPEGILATVTVSLTVTAKKMASKNCLVKNLEAVETLGSTSIICSDKTGTLTQNKMSVCHLWYNDQVINADVSMEQQDAQQYIEDPNFLMLMRCATLCNRAEFKSDSNEKPAIAREVVGDASEAAILKFVELTKAHGSPSIYRYTHPKLIEIPFNSNTKFQVSIHPFDNTCLLVMKGAPERILDRCSTILMNHKTVDLSKSLRNMCDTACLELASKGERVLGFCDLLLEQKPSFGFTNDPAPNFPLEKVRFLGFISLVDPPRPQVHDAVEKCRTAGIKVIMITGDHPVTAKAIAEMVGIITKEQIDETIDLDDITIETKDDSALIMTGATLRDLSGDELDRILYSYPEIVFARTSPTQKLQIVEGLQRLGKIVAVTGDGVNDAPALKKADIGVAMGISGSEVSKQSADMILLDDNFSSIVTGIEEGRKIFDNLKKSIVYTLASNVPESTPFLMFVLFNIPLPLGVLAVLCIDVLTDMMPAISMAYEPAESDIMLRPPRNPNRDNLVTFKLYFLAYGHIGIIETLAGFFTYFMIMFEYGFMPNRLFGLRSEWDTYYINDLKDSYGQEWAYEDRKRLEYTCSTGFMIAVIVCQWGDIVACKTKHNSIIQQGFTNWILNFSVLVETLQAIFLSYAPYMNYLKFYPIKFRWWLYGMPFAVAIVLFDEYRKGCIRSNPGGYFYRETYY